MNELGYGWAVVLGAIQGLTEFLPVSSSAHLAFAQRWMGLDPQSLPLLLFDGFAHVGTVIAIFIVFADPLAKYLRRLARECATGWTRRRYALRILGLGICASIPTAAIGLGFKSTFEAAFGDMRGIAVGLLITGVLLAATAGVRRGRKGWKDFSVGHAVLIGIAQGMAIFPGVSRSGSTICTATFLGIRRRWAAEFSFYIAIPAILGATAIKFKDAAEPGWQAMASQPWGPIAVGSVVSLVLGVVSLRCLLSAVRRAKLHYFAAYCWLLGAIVLLGLA